MIMKKSLLIFLFILGIPMICLSQFYPSGGYQGGGHGSGGDTHTEITGEILSDLQDQLRLYPNPTNGMLTIESNSQGWHSIEISMLNGQVIFLGEMEGNTHQLDLTSYRKGLYFITIETKDYVTTRKIIRQ